MLAVAYSPVRHRYHGDKDRSTGSATIDHRGQGEEFIFPPLILLEHPVVSDAEYMVRCNLEGCAWYLPLPDTLALSPLANQKSP